MFHFFEAQKHKNVNSQKLNLDAPQQDTVITIFALHVAPHMCVNVGYDADAWSDLASVNGIVIDDRIGGVVLVSVISFAI